MYAKEAAKKLQSPTLANICKCSYKNCNML